MPPTCHSSLQDFLSVRLEHSRLKLPPSFLCCVEFFLSPGAHVASVPSLEGSTPSIAMLGLVPLECSSGILPQLSQGREMPMHTWMFGLGWVVALAVAALGPICTTHPLACLEVGQNS